MLGIISHTNINSLRYIQLINIGAVFSYLLGTGILLILIGIVITIWWYCFRSSGHQLEEAKSALEASESRYQAIVEDQTELICRFRQDGTVTFVNQAYCRYFNLTPEQIVGKSFLPLIPAENQEKVSQDLKGLTQQNPVIIHEHQVIAPTGEMGWHQWTNRGIFDDKGQVREIQAVGRDITQLKQIEAELRQTLEKEKTLNQIAERIRESLDIEDILNKTCEETRQILECDRVAVYQFKPDWSGEFIAESVALGWVPLVGETVKKVWQDTFLQRTKGGRYKYNQIFAVKDIYTAGHQQCHLDLLEQFQARAYLIIPIFVQNQLWGLLASYQNSAPRDWSPQNIKLLKQISIQLGLALQQGELLSQLQKTKNAAEAANRAKSQFLAHMSHELRTPLNAILGFSQLLNHDSTLNEEQQEYIDIINRSGEHLLALIQDILDMAKIEAGQITLQRNSFNLHRLIQTLEQMFYLKAQDKGLQLFVEIDPSIPAYILTDEGKLRQVLINLLSNAIKFTQRGQIILRVSEKPDPETPYLLFEVEDSGPGIECDEAPKLFNPFFQTELGRKTQEGTGLGLAISRHFVSIMGGSLWVSCPLSGGTLFHFDLPVEFACSEESCPPKSPGRIVGLGTDQPSYRLLVVEDHPTNRQVLVNLLEPIGFQVKTADNGQEAVELWETWHPHLIWMDLHLPIMDGYEATRQIKAKMEKFPLDIYPTKIIALTASAFAQERSAMLALGCDDFVTKPFSEGIILDKIAQHLGVCYRYEQSPKALKNRQIIPVKDLRDLKSQLKKMPLNWQKELYQGAASADAETILHLIEKLPPDQTLLDKALNDLVNNFSFDLIMDLADTRR